MEIAAVVIVKDDNNIMIALRTFKVTNVPPICKTPSDTHTHTHTHTPQHNNKTHKHVINS